MAPLDETGKWQMVRYRVRIASNAFQVGPSAGLAHSICATQHVTSYPANLSGTCPPLGPE